MPIEKAPRHPLPQTYVPGASIAYKVIDGDSWASVAAKFNMTPTALIEFNFKTQDPGEINWYLRRNVGCKQTRDGKNWIFSTMMGRSVDPNFASKAADVVNMGLNIDEIYKWREEAWRTTRIKLEGH